MSPLQVTDLLLRPGVDRSASFTIHALSVWIASENRLCGGKYILASAASNSSAACLDRKAVGGTAQDAVQTTRAKMATMCRWLTLGVAAQEIWGGASPWAKIDARFPRHNKFRFYGRSLGGHEGALHRDETNKM